MLIQQGGAGGAYAFVGPLDLFASALAQEGVLKLAPGALIQWVTGATFSASSNGLNLNTALTAADFVAMQGIATPALTIGGEPAATIAYVNRVADDVFAHSVHTFNGRSGAVQLMIEDILRAGG